MQLKRKVDIYLEKWNENEDRYPLIIKGARQIGKSYAVENFGNNNYKYFIKIDFIQKKEFVDIFDNGYDIDTIIKNITLSKI